ncbi:MAG: DNA alkylation repair protein [Oscillospiraceae bacterium]
MDNTAGYVQERLLAMQDIKYRDFQAKLIPTIPKETIIGVRTPELRKLARELSKMPEGMEFLKILPHEYFEENNLHGFMIGNIRNFDAALLEVERFLPFIDNWATCDQTSPKALKKNLPALYERIKVWIRSEHVYTVRFGLGMLLEHFLDENFRQEMLELAASVHSEEYYINMMSAWYFATALTKQYDAAIGYIEGFKLPKWTHNKTIQKAIESYRVPDERKAYLRTLKVK